MVERIKDMARELFRAKALTTEEEDWIVSDSVRWHKDKTERIPIIMIKKFLQDEYEVEAFITGPAGSGKTTDLDNTIKLLNKLGVTYQVVTYTHKAKDILIQKLPKGTPISTLHAWLKKRPGINERAKHIKALMTSHQHGKPEPLELLVVDEFSFVGEKDYWSIGELQDEVLLEESVTTRTCDNCGSTDITDDGLTCIKCAEDGVMNTEIIEEVGKIPKPLKVLYVGDLNQLSPIDGPPAVQPHRPYWTKLTKIYRNDSPGLQEPLSKLVRIIEGEEEMSYLEPTEDFLRGQNIDKLYKDDKDGSKIMLAFTNEAVQIHNQTIQGYKEPKVGDTIWNSTLKIEQTIAYISNSWIRIDKFHKGVTTPQNRLIDYNTKFNPVDFLDKHKAVKFYRMEDGTTIAGIFGSYNNKIIRQSLGKKLVELNKKEKDSKKVYREYKTINDYVCNIDFNHCMTIHKSQGSEFDHVYLDSKDLAKCLDHEEMIKLFYVSISRAKFKIFLSN